MAGGVWPNRFQVLVLATSNWKSCWVAGACRHWAVNSSASQADPASPYYGRYLSAAQFDAAFGPTADRVTQVETALRAAGLTPGQASADRLSIPVTGTAAQVQRAFGTTLATYRLAGGRVAFANTSAPQVQAGVAPLIQGVIGLDDLFQAHSMMSPKTTDTTKARALMAAMAAQPAGLVPGWYCGKVSLATHATSTTTGSPPTGR